MKRVVGLWVGHGIGGLSLWVIGMEEVASNAKILLFKLSVTFNPLFEEGNI